MRGTRSDPWRAATIGALSETGYSVPAIAELTDTPRGSVWGILHGASGYVNGPVLSKLRQAVKDRLQARSLDLADRALDQVELALPEAGARDAAVVYGILRDHERLDAGESTANIAIFAKVEVENLDQLGDKVAHSLLRVKSNV